MFDTEPNEANDPGGSLQHNNQHDDNLDSYLTEQEVRRAVFMQKSGKSPGKDELPSEIIKSAYELISPFLVNLYNKMFENGEYPAERGKGIIAPIFKKGYPNKAESYR